MEFVIGKPVKTKNTKSAYVVEIEAMMGDADGYKTVKLGPFPENKVKWLEEAVKVCEEMVELYRHTGKGGYEGYEKIEGYNQWFGYEWDDEGDFNKQKRKLGAEWPSYDDGLIYSAESYEIFYFDENGIKHHVKVKK